MQRNASRSSAPEESARASAPDQSHRVVVPRQSIAAADPAEPWREWLVPLSSRGFTLAEAKESLEEIGLMQRDVPWIVKLFENPRYQLPGLPLFHGATDLHAHDCIHLLLGRGLLPKDEAFVIGFTMGSAAHISRAEEKLFSFLSRRIYPPEYRFSAEDSEVFSDALHLARASRCRALSAVNFDELRDLTLAECRARVGLHEGLLRGYYRLEQQRYPHCPESQRLLS